MLTSQSPEWFSNSINQGDDIAGVVHAVGTGVVDFKPGDRVAAFHEIGAPGGSYAEFAVAWDYTTFHVPEGISFEGEFCGLLELFCCIPLILLVPSLLSVFHHHKPVGADTFILTTSEAATLPLAFMTAAQGMHFNLGLPPPWTPATTRTPLIIYGGASAVGAFALKLANLSNIHPLIAIAGAGAPFVETLLDRSKGDTIVDYRNSDAEIIGGIKNAIKAAGGCDGQPQYAFDATTAHNSWANIAAAMDPASAGSITFILFDWQDKGLRKTLKLTQTRVSTAHESGSQDTEREESKKDDGDKAHRFPGFVPAKAFALAWFRLLTLGLKDGWMTPHPYEVVPGGLGGVGKALRDLKAGKASAVKYVLRVGETEGL